MAAQVQQDYITRTEAQQEIARLVQEQAGAFLNQQQIEIFNHDARSLIDQLANDADAALKNKKAEAEKQIVTQVWQFREQTQSAVTTVEGKLAGIEGPIFCHDDAQALSAKCFDEQVQRMDALMKTLQTFAEDVETNIKATQAEVNRTQQPF